MKLTVYEVDGTRYDLDGVDDWTLGTVRSHFAKKLGVDESRISIFFRGMLQSNLGLSIRVLKQGSDQYMIINVMEVAPVATTAGVSSPSGDKTVLQDLGV